MSSVSDSVAFRCSSAISLESCGKRRLNPNIEERKLHHSKLLLVPNAVSRIAMNRRLDP